MSSNKSNQNPRTMLQNPIKSAEIVASIDDLLTQILLKLPIKSLIRFKSVSKRWFTLISDPEFCFLRNPNPNPAIGIFLGFDFELRHKYQCISLYPKNPTLCPPPINLGFTKDPFRNLILDCCNGLFLCCSSCTWAECGFSLHEDDCALYVYNPTTNCSAIIPEFDSGSRLGATLVYDPVKSPHYKVVCVRLMETPNGRKNHIEIYSSETGKWMVWGDIGTTGLRYRDGVYCNGAIHWLHDLSRMNVGDKSIRFHVDSEVLEEIPSPPVELDFVKRNNYYFGESCDHLHFVESGLIEFNVYEMKMDYSRVVC